MPRVVNAIKEFGFEFGVSEEIFGREGQMFRMGIPPFRIELLTAISGVAFKSAFAHRVMARIDGIEVNVISLEDLQANKRASGRHKDLADLEKLDEVPKGRT